MRQRERIAAHRLTLLNVTEIPEPLAELFKEMYNTIEEITRALNGALDGLKAQAAFAEKLRVSFLLHNEEIGILRDRVEALERKR